MFRNIWSSFTSGSISLNSRSLVNVCVSVFVEVPAGQGCPVSELNRSPLAHGVGVGVLGRGVYTGITFLREGTDPLIVVDVVVVVGAEMVNEVSVSVLLTFEEASVTVIVQSEYVPTASVSSVIVFDPEVAEVVTDEQEPPYVIVPASFVVNV